MKLPYTPMGIIRSALRMIWLRSRERHAALKRTEYHCEQCGKKQRKGDPLHVHHLYEVDWARIEAVIRSTLLVSPDHLIPLCEDCHNAAHSTTDIRKGDGAPAAAGVATRTPFHTGKAKKGKGNGKTLYLCGPVSGMKDGNAPLFRKCELALNKAGYDTVNPTRLGMTVHTPWPQAMRRCIAEMVISCDGIATVPGWTSTSRGSVLELHISSNLGMAIGSVEEWKTSDLTSAEKCDLLCNGSRAGNR